MNSRAIRTLQRVLAAGGSYSGPINGMRDPATVAAVDLVVLPRAGELTQDPGPWTAARRAVACLQLACRDRGIPAGPADGLWGQQTDTGHEELVVFLETGARPQPWRDREPSAGNPNAWPSQAEADLRAFYGPPLTKDQLVPVPCPWRLAIAWDQRQSTRTISCHPKVAASLQRVLGRIHAHYGETRLQELRLHLYGGCHNDRAMRGGTRRSTHAWGIALDWDPDHNRLDWGRDRAALAGPAYEPWWRVWEDEGWVSLGRHRNFDWMHVQAARL